ncbi:unnamed protein product [Coregonus sp. 'balchen']|nr:unnamed protein product [Coregonus sp. 'balchen']
MTGLHKLETLNLAGNKLSSIRKEEFKGLASLKTLLLFDNQIASMEDGAFEGLVNLIELKLDSNKIPQIDIRKTVLSGLPRLRTLDISCNYITYVNDDKLNPPPFSHLTSLENLHIHSQRHKGLSHLPINFLEGLKSLLAFKAGSLNIKDLHPDTFIHTPRLWYLDISKNEFTALMPKLFHPTPRLNRLYLSKARLQSLDFLIGANLSRVTFLQVSKNDITVVNETVLRYLPALTYLDMQDNAFTCGCSNTWFVQWMESDNQTQVVGAGEFTCNYPAELKDTKLLDVELQFCTVHIGLYYYISTTCLVLLTLIASFAYHFLKWQVIYGYYLFLAILYDTKQRNKHMPHGCQYDAFISYNAHDEPWVLRELLPELEGEQGWKLQAKPIIDNIMDGIYGSRKTICVISRRYLESEWCSREIQVASFRLFDEQKDVLILVFLEEIPPHQLSPYHRMRKLVKRRTYLSWPRAGEHTGVFWQQLRLALETKDGPEEENPILSGVEALSFTAFTSSWLSSMTPSKGISACLMAVSTMPSLHLHFHIFISYNAHDEPWVLRELLPELEGEQDWKLCLHHRNFQPGKPIIDNIIDGSRKTICVISHRYLESEWCSREIQVASFRLFDEQKDVLILMFLEKIPTHQLSPYHRMRKLVKRRTYLTWPRAGEHTRVFWQQLRLALETKDGPAEENPILSGVEAL